MEMVEKFDNKRFPLNKVTERYESIDGEFKQTMHVWIKNSEGKYLIQKRAAQKKVFPNFWSITGGGVDCGETTYDTVIRECKEELGVNIESEKLELMLTLKRKDNFLDVWLYHKDINLNDIIMQEEEVSDVKWVTIEEIYNMIDEKIFAPNVSAYFDIFLKLVNKEI